MLVFRASAGFNVLTLLAGPLKIPNLFNNRDRTSSLSLLSSLELLRLDIETTDDADDDTCDGILISLHINDAL